MVATAIAFPKSAVRTISGTLRLAVANARPSLALRTNIGTMLPVNASAWQTEKVAALIATGTLPHALASAFPFALARIKRKAHSTGTTSVVSASATGSSRLTAITFGTSLNARMSSNPSTAQSASSGTRSPTPATS
jgi:hypothetical protein